MPARPAHRRAIVFDLHRDIAPERRPAGWRFRIDEAVQHVRLHHAPRCSPKPARALERAIKRGYYLGKGVRLEDDAEQLAWLHYCELTPSPVAVTVTPLDGRQKARVYRIELRFMIINKTDVLKDARSAIVAMTRESLPDGQRVLRRRRVVTGAGCRHEFVEVILPEISERTKDRLLDVLDEETLSAAHHDKAELAVRAGLSLVRTMRE